MKAVITAANYAMGIMSSRTEFVGAVARNARLFASSSSSSWLKRQRSDKFVLQASSEGLRSRSAYKLEEINSKFRLIKKGSLVVDLGCAPGGWSIVALKAGADKVVGVDLLPVKPLEATQTGQGQFIFIKGDMGAVECQEDVRKVVGGTGVHLVMSDMAPNAMGNAAIDHIRIIELCNQAANFAAEVLCPGGSFVCKFWNGAEEKLLRTRLSNMFAKVHFFKPEASRSESSEAYFVALKFGQSREK